MYRLELFQLPTSLFVLLAYDCYRQTITTSMYKTTENLPGNASTFLISAKSLPALSNPLIVTAANVEFHC